MKSYIEFLKKNDIIENIINILEPSINDLLKKIEDNLFEETGKMFTAFQKECEYLHLVYDLIKSVEKYTTNTDVLVSISSRYSRKGNLEISAEIKRENKLYNLYTEVIIAGGYNIQVAHYRYLTKTDLPKTNNSILTNEFSDKIKKLTKIEKFKKEIEYFQNRINKNNEEVEKSSLLSDSDIFELLTNEEYGRLLLVTWETLNSDSHAKQTNTKDSWEESQKIFIKRKIDFWKYLNVENKISNTKALELNIKKIQEKINKL